MDTRLVLDVLLIVAGGFSIAGGVSNWDWFMNARRAQLFVGLFGRNGARVFYVVLGLTLIGIAFHALLE